MKRVFQAFNKHRLFKNRPGSQRCKIRANHLYSMQVEDFDLNPLLSDSDCTYALHGTQLEVLESILKRGLSSIRINYIDFITGETTFDLSRMTLKNLRNQKKF